MSFRITNIYFLKKMLMILKDHYKDLMSNNDNSVTDYGMRFGRYPLLGMCRC